MTKQPKAALILDALLRPRKFLPWHSMPGSRSYALTYTLVACTPQTHTIHPALGDFMTYPSPGEATRICSRPPNVACLGGIILPLLASIHGLVRHDKAVVIQLCRPFHMIGTIAQ